MSFCCGFSFLNWAKEEKKVMDKSPAVLTHHNENDRENI